MIKRVLFWMGVAAVAALAAVLIAAGVWLLFTTFMLYDDEGYVLLSLKNFSSGGGLYDHVYSQYGPFLYLLYDALHRVLGFDFTNTTGRWITLITWFGTAAACAAMVARRTRSILWTAFTLAGVFTYLWVMINEPIHPGGLLSVLVALGVWLGAEAWEAGKVRRFAIITGLVGAALAMTKINVGVFFLGASFTWLAVNTAPSRVARQLAWLVAFGCAVLPFGLMNSLWDSQWVRIFAVVFTAGSLGTLLAAREVAHPVAGRNAWAWFLGIAAGAMALICALTLVRGTSLGGLIDGVIFEPFKHPRIYFFPVDWRGGTTAIALAGVVAIGLIARKGKLGDARFRTGIILVRVAAAAFFLSNAFLGSSLAGWGMSYGVGLAWVFVVPVHGGDRTSGVRAWTALALVFQCLHAYPVAGSQINWGSYLWVPLLALGLHDTALAIKEHVGRWRLPALAAGGLVVASATVAMARQLEEIGRGRYYSTDLPLGIPGAENIRPPADTGYDLRVVNENLREHAAMVFGFPGLYSINLWTGLPTPTLTNATHWFSLLSPTRQQEIIDSLAATPRAVLVVQRDVVDYLAAGGFKMEGPLHDWLMANFESAFKVDGYEFWVHRGRKIAALSTARYSQMGDQATLTLTLKAPPRPIQSVDVKQVFGNLSSLLHLGPENAKFTTEEIDLEGRTISMPADGSPVPVPSSSLVRMTITFTSKPIPLTMRAPVIIVPLDAAGGALGALRVVE